MEFKNISRCRVCGSKNLKSYFNLGNVPLSNALLKTQNQSSKKYPLEVLFCQECSLSQLGVVVNPKILFKDYPYHSSISRTFQDHCLKMAHDIRRILPNAKSVMDIASNDGCLLKQFKSIGYLGIGVDPSSELVKECKAKGVPAINRFWDVKASNLFQCDVITATNVLAHVDDVKTFVSLFSNTIKPYGVIVVEVPYLYNMISGNQFDTIYHEHLSYFLFKPLKMLFESCGMPIFKVDRNEIHGGSLRVYASKSKYPKHRSIKDIEKFELKNKMHTFKTYKNYSNKIAETKKNFINLIKSLKSSGKEIIGYCASAKGINLLNHCGITREQIPYIADDTPEKQGKYTPGSRIKIVHPFALGSTKFDYIVLLSWNFSKEIIEKTKAHRRMGGKYILPIPKAVVMN